MLKNLYLKNVYDDLCSRYFTEKEYLSAVYEVLDSLDVVISQNIEYQKLALIERLVEPERIILFRIPWINDLGEVKINRGYRVQFNSSLGPYKGGIRFHPSVNLSIIKALAFEQTFKNSLTSLNIGGGKGGSDFDPKGKSDLEIMRFCQSFMNELARHIGSHTDIPAGDIGVSQKEIGYLFGQYKRLQNEFSGVITSKNIIHGGSLVRKEATGYGLCYFVEAMLSKMLKTNLKEKRVVISGSGNVAIYALEKIISLGGSVVAMSDSNGFIYDEKGINLGYIKEIKEIRKNRIRDYLNYVDTAIYYEKESIWQIKCDIALPCATQNELDIEDAVMLVENGCILIAEGANMPLTHEAIQYLYDKKVLYAPGKASNAGGVIVSTYEMSQNALFSNWEYHEVEYKLKILMEKIFDELYEVNLLYNLENDFKKAANIYSFLRLKNSMILQGIV